MESGVFRPAADAGPGFAGAKTHHPGVVFGGDENCGQISCCPRSLAETGFIGTNIRVFFRTLDAANLN